MNHTTKAAGGKSPSEELGMFIGAMEFFGGAKLRLAAREPEREKMLRGLGNIWSRQNEVPPEIAQLALSAMLRFVRSEGAQ